MKEKLADSNNFYSIRRPILEELTCKKVTSMISLYIDDRLNDEHRLFVENHFKKCPQCFQKYKEMKNIIENLKLSYEKILKEVEGIETVNLFNIREYEKFYNNISAYIDNELTYEESIEFRKYLLKSKAGRVDLRNHYNLENHIQDSVSKCINKLDINLSKSIIKNLKEEREVTNKNLYLKVAILTGLLVVTTSGMYMFKHSDKNYNQEPTKREKKVIYVKRSGTPAEVKGLLSNKKP